MRIGDRKSPPQTELKGRKLPVGLAQHRPAPRRVRGDASSARSPDGAPGEGGTIVAIEFSAARTHRYPVITPIV
jgi:hypothetical protein